MARSFGLSVRSLEVGDASQLDGAFATAAQDKARAVIVLSDGALYAQRVQIAKSAEKHRLPCVAWTPEFAESGCLVAYGANVVEMHRRAAVLVDKILKGAKPGDLPVEQPTKFELVMNLKTARALGLTIPSMVLARADRSSNDHTWHQRASVPTAAQQPIGADRLRRPLNRNVKAAAQQR